MVMIRPAQRLTGACISMAVRRLSRRSHVLVKDRRSAGGSCAGARWVCGTGEVMTRSAGGGWPVRVFHVGPGEGRVGARGMRMRVLTARRVAGCVAAISVGIVAGGLGAVFGDRRFGTS